MSRSAGPRTVREVTGEEVAAFVRARLAAVRPRWAQSNRLSLDKAGRLRDSPRMKTPDPNPRTAKRPSHGRRGGPSAAK
jgi:hypothetical protein